MQNIELLEVKWLNGIRSGLAEKKSTSANVVRGWRPTAGH